MGVVAEEVVRLRIPRDLSSESLADVLGRLRSLERRGVLVLEGERDVFCRGLDLASLGHRAPEAVEAGLRSYADLLRTLRVFPRPTLALVEGFAAGGGVGLAAVCDVVVARSTARFALPEGLFGLYPAMVLAVLDERMAPGRSRRLALTCESIDAEDALGAGLVDRVVPEDGEANDMEKALGREVRRMLRCHPRAVEALKCHPPWLERLDATLEAGREHTALALADPSVRERIERYLENDLSLSRERTRER
jgi:enoyl-CoA hydratase/carnithine racemase